MVNTLNINKSAFYVDRGICFINELFINDQIGLQM